MCIPRRVNDAQAPYVSVVCYFLAVSGRQVVRQAARGAWSYRIAGTNKVFLKLSGRERCLARKGYKTHYTLGCSMESKPKLLDQMRQVMWLKHMSIRTEETYVSWAKRFILFH